MVVIADCGLPIPDGVKKIDLALKLGTPGFIEVVELVAQYMQIEKATIASEIHAKNPATYVDLERVLGEEASLEELSHEEFKLLTHKARAIIRTGEATPYANVVLHAGVIF
jgi:D-ribose pyranase